MCIFYVFIILGIVLETKYILIYVWQSLACLYFFLSVYISFRSYVCTILWSVAPFETFKMSVNPSARMFAQFSVCVSVHMKHSQLRFWKVYLYFCLLYNCSSFCLSVHMQYQNIHLKCWKVCLYTICYIIVRLFSYLFVGSYVTLEISFFDLKMFIF